MNPVQLDQLLLVLIGLILVANTAVVAVGPRRVHRGWRSTHRLRRWAGGSSTARPGDDRPESLAVASPRTRADRGGDAETAAAIEAFVAGVDGGVARGATGGLRAPARVVPEPDRAASSTRTTQASASPESAAFIDEAAAVAWDRLLHDEGARVARFGRPVTVAYVECPDLEVLAGRLGQVAADRIAAEMAWLLHAQLRETDRIVRLGRARFGVLLVETDEVDALLFAERVRAAADDWLESTRLTARLAIGLASPDEGRDLALAEATARERLDPAARRPALGDAIELRRDDGTGQAGKDDRGANHQPIAGPRRLTERT
jgi:GGDEF domain-containing protein